MINGRVTWVISSGNSIVQSDAVIAVNGIQRLAMISDEPLWRNLTLGSVGGDVRAVADLLADVGISDEPSARNEVDELFISAVRRFEQRYGWPESGIFKPEYVVWIPAQPFVIDGVEVDVNTFLEAETLIATGEATLAAATVVSLTQDSSLVLPQAPVVFEIPDTLVVPVSADGTVSDPDALIALADRLRPARPANPALAVSPGQLGVARSDPGVGVVRLAEPRRLQTVPTAAVMVGLDGATCVVSRQGDILRVAVTGGVGGVTEIEPSLDPEVQVVVNPSETAHSC